MFELFLLLTFLQFNFFTLCTCILDLIEMKYNIFSIPSNYDEDIRDSIGSTLATKLIIPFCQGDIPKSKSVLHLHHLFSDIYTYMLLLVQKLTMNFFAGLTSKNYSTNSVITIYISQDQNHFILSIGNNGSASLKKLNVQNHLLARRSNHIYLYQTRTQ